MAVILQKAPPFNLIQGKMQVEASSPSFQATSHQFCHVDVSGVAPPRARPRTCLVSDLAIHFQVLGFQSQVGKRDFHFWSRNHGLLYFSLTCLLSFLTHLGVHPSLSLHILAPCLECHYLQSPQQTHTSLKMKPSSHLISQGVFGTLLNSSNILCTLFLCYRKDHIVLYLCIAVSVLHVRLHKHFEIHSHISYPCVSSTQHNAQPLVCFGVGVRKRNRPQVRSLKPSGQSEVNLRT